MLRAARFAACKSMALLERTFAEAAEAPLPTPLGLVPYIGATILRGGIPVIRLKFSDEPIFKRG